MYQDFDYGLARERTAQMREEVERNRLKARLARTARSDEDGVASRGWVASSARHRVVQVGGLLWALLRSEGGEAEGPLSSAQRE